MLPLSIKSNILNPTYNKVITSEAEEAFTQEEKVFFVCTELQDISSNRQLILQLGNPAESGICISIRKLFLCTNSESYTEIYRNCGFSEYGNHLKPHNAHASGLNNSLIDAQYIMPNKYININGCDLLATYIQIGGTEITDFGGILKLYPGSTFTVCTNSKSNNISHMSITVSYSESLY